MKKFKSFAMGIAVLGAAALIWLMFAEGLHSFRKELLQDTRAAAETLSKVWETTPVTITVKNKQSECIKIEKAIIDDGQLLVYYRNTCVKEISCAYLKWQGKAADGTVVYSYSVSADNIRPGDRYEFASESWQFKPDPRMVTLEVWAETYY